MKHLVIEKNRLRTTGLYIDIVGSLVKKIFMYLSLPLYICKNTYK